MSSLKDNSTTIFASTGGTVVDYNQHAYPTVSISSGSAISNSTAANASLPILDSIDLRLARIEKQLAILTPDLVKLEKFAALQKAYDNYIIIDKLCEE